MRLPIRLGPPRCTAVGLLADAQILGRLTGAVILVIRAGATPYALVERANSPDWPRIDHWHRSERRIEETSSYAKAYYGDYQPDQS